MAKDVIIVGGGIAGIACALHLADHGMRVTLLETRKKLGGRATSFTDVRTGLVIDNCQHVALGCCTNYLDFCRRLGVEEKIRWQEEIYWVEAGGRVSVMRPGSLPAPAHFAGAFLGVKFLSAGEKLCVARAMNAILRMDRVRAADMTFARWLADHGQRAAVVRKFWEPIVVSACNLNSERVSAAAALHVFQEGFLAHRDAARVGVAAVPLVELYDPAEAAIRRAGGEVRLGAGVERIFADRVVTTGGEELRAEAVVCAVPPERAARMMDESVRRDDPRFDLMSRVTHSPILGVHMVFDRPVMPMHSAVLVEQATQWLFRKDASRGAHVHAVISAADEWMALDEEEISRRVLADIHACFPRACDARLVSSRPVKEKLATFAPTPHVEALRPATLGVMGPRGVILAGDFVQTGWPATMEGAARSGYMAAAAVLGRPVDEFVRASLRQGWVVRTMARRIKSPG